MLLCFEINFFEAFHWNISLSTNPKIVRSDLLVGFYDACFSFEASV